MTVDHHHPIPPGADRGRRAGSGEPPPPSPARPVAGRRAEARRRQILDAASDCFCRHGFHGASMAQIAKAAGMSPGHIYHYFQSKEDIINAIVQSDLADTLVVMDDIVSQGGDLLQALLASVGQGVAKMLDPRKAAMTLEVMAEAARNPRVAAMVRQADHILRHKLRELLLASRPWPPAGPEDDLDGRVEVLSTLFGGLCLRAISHPGLDPAAVTRLHHRTIEHLITA